MHVRSPISVLFRQSRRRRRLGDWARDESTPVAESVSALSVASMDRHSKHGRRAKAANSRRYRGGVVHPSIHPWAHGTPTKHVPGHVEPHVAQGVHVTKADWQSAQVGVLQRTVDTLDVGQGQQQAAHALGKGILHRVALPVWRPCAKKKTGKKDFTHGGHFDVLQA